MLLLNGRKITHPNQIQEAFISFYSNMLCSKLENRRRINMSTIHSGPILTPDLWPLLDLSFSPQEIKEAIWSIHDNKALGLDGFNSKFYKASWPVVSPNLVNAIQSFFRNGKLLKSWNIPAITLIPKVPCPSQPGDFRPISCCHTLYKCISKPICSRLKRVLGRVINQTQGAFVAGRLISHNILLCQDLVKHYSKKYCCKNPTYR